jgi:hypothetical protein
MRRFLCLASAWALLASATPARAELFEISGKPTCFAPDGGKLVKTGYSTLYAGAALQ